MITLLTAELLIKSFLFSWFLINFEPINTYIIGTLEGINKAIYNNYKISILYFIVGKILTSYNCPRCNGFWTGLIISSNIYVAIAVSILSLAWDKWNVNGGVKLW